MLPAMKTVFICLFAASVLFPWCSTLSAQQNTSVDGEKKITITKRTTEADGTEVSETIIKKGAAAANFDVDAYVRENRSDRVQVEVRVEDANQGKTSRQIIKKDGKNISSWSSSNTSASCCEDNRAFLGVDADSDEDASQPGIVVEIVRNSAAAKAGLKTNDVLLRLNDQAINRWSDLTAFMAKAKPGDKVRITYQRKGKEATAEATLTKHSDIQDDDDEDDRHGFLGVSTNDDYNDDDDNDTDGVVVKITENSAAEKAGLQNGDVILQLNDTEISDFEDISDFMATTKSGDPVRITYQRNGQRATVNAALGEQQDWNDDEDNWESGSWNWNSEDMEVDVQQKEACLGVYTEGSKQDKAEGARILSFTSQSAAKDAQMQENDVITAVNGQPISDHSALWTEIAKYKAGDRVKVDYLRNGEKRSVETALKICQDGTSQVTIGSGNSQGGQRKRQFTTWNWGREDQVEMRQTQMITIHKGGEGDAAKVDIPAPGSQPADRQLKLEAFRAYPNPAQGQITVEFRSAPVATVVSLLDMSGRQLFREELNMFNGDYKQQFDLSEYAKGTIIILVQQSDKSLTEQIMIN